MTQLWGWGMVCILWVHNVKSISCTCWFHAIHDIDGLVQEIHNSSALAMELYLSCTNPLISCHDKIMLPNLQWVYYVLPCLSVHLSIWVWMESSVLNLFIFGTFISNFPSISPVMWKFLKYVSFSMKFQERHSSISVIFIFSDFNNGSLPDQHQDII